MTLRPEHTLLDRATELIAPLRAAAVDAERARRVSPELTARLAQEGFFHMLVPKARGGREVHPSVFMRALDRLAQGDAAAAWCVMTGATNALLSAYLEPEAWDALAEAHPAMVSAGVYAPMGKAVVVEGGYELSGRWTFCSGCENASVRMGGALVFEDGALRTTASGAPEIRSLLFSSEDSKVIDTWEVMGLNGTGSHDIVVESLFVPQAHTACLGAQAPQAKGPLYRFPPFGLLAVGIAGVALGIARACIDQVSAMMKTKKTFTQKRTMAQGELVQLTVAEAEAERGAGESMLLDAIDRAFESAKRGQLSDQDRASVRTAATWATEGSMRAVDKMYTLAGGAAIYKRNGLERHLRDVHTLSQHIMVSHGVLKTVGKVLLSVEADTSQL